MTPQAIGSNHKGHQGHKEIQDSRTAGSVFCLIFLVPFVVFCSSSPGAINGRSERLPTKFIEVAEFFMTGLGEPFKVNWGGVIDTESNLKAKVFQGIILILGLDYAKYATAENLIDETLLDSRNKIAHGRYLLISADDYVQLHDEVINLLDRFRDGIIDAARNRTYLRSI